LSRRIETEVKQRTEDKVSVTQLAPYADCHWTIAVFFNTGPGQIAYHTLHVNTEELLSEEAKVGLIERVAKEALERYETTRKC
jgi:hypothetical protein